jgi:hypothetical protein
MPYETFQLEIASGDMTNFGIYALSEPVGS